MAKKKVPFVHSGHKRRKDDHYPTIDPRCIWGFLEHFTPRGLCVDPCSPNGSGLVDVLRVCGHEAIGLPDAFASNIHAEWITTNPPYKRGLVDRIIRRQILRVERGEVSGAAFLLRANFDFASSRKRMFAHPLYYGQIKLRFRPVWIEPEPGQKKPNPIHNFTWFVWTADAPHPPVVLYADGIPPTAVNALPGGIAINVDASESFVQQSLPI